MMRRLQAAPTAFRWLLACLCAAAWGTSQADPMRPLTPPVALGNALPAVTGASGAERQGLPRDPEASRESARLIAIRQDSTSKWQALFGERWLGVGDKFDSRTVVSAIAANSVELAEGRQRRTLHLLPPLVRPGTPGLAGPVAPATAPGLAQSPGPSTAVAQAGAIVLPAQPANGVSTP